MRKLIITLAGGFVALTAAAHAALAPQYYERARNTAPNVIVIDVERVEIEGPLLCAVHGRVSEVQRGRLYTVGAEVEISVPCIGHSRVAPPAGPAVYQDTAALRASARGRAFLDAEGRLALSQYEILAAAEDEGAASK
ncbi:MAG TPA: hypothetical protein VEA80_09255 [Vitreimonas sp.]|uniref:hypothetical protein n=1 Tax=Vitreimonas sp. TaxID=3069702 RepID=UPI002D4B9BFF|nr:hypothetical protein [Vitreimonas sp.]HYD87649.1 hypothetical protein [Vitreimonas sp.]